MGGKRVSTSEQRHIIETMMDMPKKKGETNGQYYDRLKKYGVNRSERYLYEVAEAIKGTKGEDPEEICKTLNRKLNKKKDNWEPAEEPEEEQVPGQIRMELGETYSATEMSEQTKMMRFQAAQVEKLLMKMDKLNDTMCQIIRVIRRE